MLPGSSNSTADPASETAADGVLSLLTAAVAAIGGTERDGQSRMAKAVWDAMSDGAHLAVQAGTGTGKSLAYLVPALRLATARKHGPVVVSTATIALQRQLVDRDLPRLAEALRTGTVLGHGRVYAGGLTKFEPREMERLMVPDLGTLRSHEPLSAALDA